jgi:hypothetical protein
MSVEGLAFKGSILRGYSRWLREQGHIERVLACASGEAARKLRDPPLVTEWVAGDVQFAVLDAVHAVGGDALLRAMVSGSTQTGVLKLLEPLIQGVVRVFGKSPATLFSRLDSMRGNTIRGVDFRYRSEGEKSGVIEARSQRDKLSAHSALAWAALIEALCRTLGFDDVRTSYESSGDRMGVTIRVQW